MSDRDTVRGSGSLAQTIVADREREHESPILIVGPLLRVLHRINRKRFRHRFAVFFTCDDRALFEAIHAEMIRNLSRQKKGETCVRHVETSLL
jgi:hypothetical protein